MSKAIESKIRNLMETTLGAKGRGDQEAFCNMPGWDSLRHAEFIIALQKEFRIRFSPSEIAALVNLSAAYRIVEAKT